MNNPNSSFPELVPINKFNFGQICLEPAALLKMIFLQVILKDFAKLWTKLHYRLSYVRYLMGLLQLFKTLTTVLTKNSTFFSKTSVYWLSPLSEEDPCDMKLGLINQPLFI